MPLAAQLIAHRGNCAHFPENSLTAVQRALTLGVGFVEVDIQFCRDQVPVLLHDLSLNRTSNMQQRIVDIDWPEAQTVCIGEPNRLSGFEHERLPQLSQLVTLIQAWPDRHFFIEIKEESLAYFEQNTLLKIIHETTLSVQSQCIFICYNANVLRYLRTLSSTPIGLILRRWNPTHLQTLSDLQPEYILCNVKKLPIPLHHLPNTSGLWAFYEVTNLNIAKQLQQLGATLIETMDPEKLILAAQHATP